MTTRPDPRQPNRYDVERIVERSSLPRLPSDLLHFLARRMMQGSTHIPYEHASVSLSKIAAYTKYSRRQVQRGMDYLEGAGLVVRQRPSVHDARVHHKRTAYAVVWPAVEKLPAARDITTLGLGTPRPQARDTATPDLGTPGPRARDTMALSSQTLSDHRPETDSELGLIVGLLKVRTGVTVSTEWAAETRRQLLARPGAGGSPSAYIRRVLSTDPNPQRWLPTPVPPPYENHHQVEAS